MPRRRRPAETDSMDMLLDTITNAFGGIVLLALLVTLILGQQNPSTAGDKNRDASLSRAELNQQLDQAAEERRLLESAIVSQKQQIEMFRDADTDELAKKMLSEQLRSEQLTVRLKQSKQRLADAVGRIADLRESTVKTESELAAAAEELAVLESLIAEEKKRRTRTMETPREVATLRKMTVGLVRNNAFHIVDANRGRNLLVPNKSHLQSAKESDADIILAPPGGNWKIIPGQGIPLDDSDSLRDEIDKFPANDVHLVLIVWPDSFEKFSAIRDACVAAGLEHKILPIEKGPVVEGPSTRGATAQ